MRQRGLALFFTRNVALSRWRDNGYLEREAAYYRALSEEVGPVTWVTYGGEADAALGAQLPGVTVLNNPRRLPPADFARWAAVEYREHFRPLALLKTNQVMGARAAIMAGRAVGRPVVLRSGYLRALLRYYQGASLRERFGIWRREFALYRAAGCAMVTTHSDAAYLRRWYGLPAAKVHVAPNFVPVDIFQPHPEIEPEPGLIGFVGRIGGRQKNLPALVKAVAGLASDLGSRLLLIGPVGQDARSREVIAAIHELGLPVELAGVVSYKQLPLALARCQIFALPSLSEGHPKALLEAMACGLAVVGVDAPGVRDVITHQQNGLLAADPSPQAIGAALATLLKDAALRRRLGEEARRYILANFTLEHTLQAEIAAYRRMGYIE